MVEILVDADGEGAGLYCAGCGYDLRTTETGRCPECGAKFVRGELAVSRIPWVHRRALGRVRAWRRTVWMVMWRPGEVGAEVARPVEWRDAKRFSWVMIGVAAVMVGAAVGAMYPWMKVEETFRVGIESVAVPGEMWRLWGYPLVALWTGPGLVGVAVLGVLAGLGAVMWWVRLWFWMLGREQRERASAVACYASAWWMVLGLLAVGDIGLAVGDAYLETLPDSAGMWMGIGIFVVHAVVLLFMWIGVMRELQRATRRGWMAIAGASVGMVVGGAVVFAVVALAVDYLLGLGAMALWSLWG